MEEARRREIVEQERLAERRRQEQRKERQRREEQIWRDARLARLESEWKQFGAQVSAAQRETMRRAFFAHYDMTFNELHAYFNPPPPPEPEVIYIEQSDGSPHLGPDYNPKLAGQAVLRWW